MRVGIAYSGATPKLLADASGLIDFVEVSFEALRGQRDLLEGLRGTDVVLHCASLSVGGETEPAEDTVAEVQRSIDATKTEWLGEHLAFINGRRPDESASLGAASAGVTNIGFTVGPAYSERLLDAVIARLDSYESRFGIPVALENAPTYFELPGSSMSQVEFFATLCAKRPSTKLLLDLTHFMITATNLQFDVFDSLSAYPINNVVELHLSGIATEDGLAWDDHATPVPDTVWGLLERVMPECPAKAVTLEYNWSTTFPRSVILNDLKRIRSCIRSGADVRRSHQHEQSL